MAEHVKTDPTLCSQCGACAAVCPKGAITLPRDPAGNYYPRVDEETCGSACGLCASVCAGNGIDWPGLHESRFAAPYTAAPIGHCVAAYSGWALEDHVRKASASGGLVTALLCHMLETHAIDAACVTVLDGFEPSTRLATTREEVLAAAGSVYFCNPAVRVIKQLKTFPGRVGFVGLPCHINSLNKAIRCGAVGKDKIALMLGIFCGRTATLDLMRSFLRRKGLDPADVREMHLRGNGWPGTFRFTMQDGSKHEFPFPPPEYMAMWKFYQHTPPYCLLCSDPLAALADVSFGDAWLPRFRDDKLGTSSAVVRTRAGADALARAQAQSVIQLDPIDPAEIIKSQRQQVFSKQTNQRNVRHIAKLLRKPLPEDTGTMLWPKGKLLGLAYAAFQWANCLLSRRPATKWVLNLLPLMSLTKLLRRKK